LSRSSKYTVARAMRTEGNPICIFRIHKLVLDPFNIFSKYTPAKPDVMVAQNTDKSPIKRFREAFSPCARTPSLLSPDNWTIATPIVKRNKENHFCPENVR
jgi:hypothetical protein